MPSDPSLGFRFVEGKGMDSGLGSWARTHSFSDHSLGLYGNLGFQELSTTTTNKRFVVKGVQSARDGSGLPPLLLTLGEKLSLRVGIGRLFCNLWL